MCVLSFGQLWSWSWFSLREPLDLFFSIKSECRECSTRISYQLSHRVEKWTKQSIKINSSHFWRSLSPAVWCCCAPSNNANRVQMKIEIDSISKNNKYPRQHAASNIWDATAMSDLHFVCWTIKKRSIGIICTWKITEKTMATSSSSNCFDFSVYVSGLGNAISMIFLSFAVFSIFKLESNWTKTRKLTCPGRI